MTTDQDRIDSSLCTPQRNFGARIFEKKILSERKFSANLQYSLQSDLHAFSAVINFTNSHNRGSNCATKHQLRGVTNAHPSYWSFEELSTVFAVWRQNVQPTLYLVSDILKTIEDPRWLLAEIRKALLEQKEHRCLFSFVDVPSPDVVRTWTKNEFIILCQSVGFTIEETHGSDLSFEVLVSCSPAMYQAFLEKHEICTTSYTEISRLLVTMEYPLIQKSGGIGSYCQELLQLLQHTHVALCFIGNKSARDIDGTTMEHAENALGIVQQKLFFFPHIETIEYHDYYGVGARIVQAKRASLLPQGIILEAACHGSTIYIESANQRWSGTEENEQIMLEKISIEGADSVKFPTAFLRDFYRDSGYVIPEEKIFIERYPFNIPTPSTKAFGSLKRLVFVGKQGSMKGFPDFLEVVNELIQNSELPELKEIVCFGPVLELSPLDNHRKEFIKTKISWREEFVTREELSKELAILASDSLAYLPYRADNHPYVILELVTSGMPCVAYNTGGIPELIPSHYHNLYLATPHPQAAKKKIHQWWHMPRALRQEQADCLSKEVCQLQEEINQTVYNRYTSKSNILLSEPHIVGAKKYEPSLTVIIPVYNTKFSFVSALLASLLKQTMAPEELLFIDDASSDDYFEQLKILLKKECHLAYRCIRHSHNKGLCAARNTGLQECRTNILVNIDSDDLVNKDFLSIIQKTFARNPHAAAVVPYLQAFEGETSDFEDDDVRYIYRPLGEGLIRSQTENRLGHANSGYAVSILRSIGGWNESSRAMWEDWELYEKLISQEEKIIIVPQIAVYYRILQKSMARTYPRFPAMVRVASGCTALPRFEALRLQAAMREHHSLLEMKEKYLELTEQYKEMSAQYNRFAHRFMHRIIRTAEIIGIDSLVRKIRKFF